MDIKILGTGCKKCATLYKNVNTALEQENITANVEKVEALEEILKYNVMVTPALVVNEVVVSKGKVLKPKEIIGFIK